jgi:hypothetical protein
VRVVAFRAVIFVTSVPCYAKAAYFVLSKKDEKLYVISRKIEFAEGILLPIPEFKPLSDP